MRAKTMKAMFSKQAGVALILVLWVTMLLTVIAGSFAYATRTDMSVLGNHVQRARAEAAADAGVYRAVLETFRPVSDVDRWLFDGTEHQFQLGEATVRVSLRDESAKIDVNGASAALLKGLFVSVGLPDLEATRLQEAIQDWTDPDQLVRPNGAEEQAYRDAGLKQQPFNAPFQTLEELRLVRGMTADLYRRIEPMITIYSRQPGVNVSIASREVLVAIPGITAAQVDEYIAARAVALAAKQPPPPFPAAAAYAAAPNLLGIEVRSEATLGDTRFERLAVIKIIPDPKRPFSIFAWSEGKVWAQAAGASDGQ
jgi:general secretion pathway protein K